MSQLWIKWGSFIECFDLCVNCQGNHPSKSKKCERYLAEKEIIKIKIKQNISFPEARRIFDQTGGVSSYAEAAQKSELLSIVNQLKADNKNLNKKLEEITKLNLNLNGSIRGNRDRKKTKSKNLSTYCWERSQWSDNVQELRRENIKLTKQQETKETENTNQEITPTPVTNQSLDPTVEVIEPVDTISSDESVHSDNEAEMEVDTVTDRNL